jgi:lysophospholipase L1-like esterase
MIGIVSPGVAQAAPPAGKPTAVVALGDSMAAGEGGGQYRAGTRGEKGDWCHRSANAYVERTGVAKVAVNLACSGASTADLAFGAPGHYTEGSQAQRLGEVARAIRVTHVLVQVGANDEPAFGTSVVRCVAVFLSPASPDCSTALARDWPARLSRMAPKADKALADVRTAMRRAGYADGDYQLVVLSYPSPVTENMTRTHGLTGCPFRKVDARWGRTEAVPQLSSALRGVAERAGARFLDLSRAAEGHEACAAGGGEWVRRLTINPKAFVEGGGLAAVGHLAQESFHPNATGHTKVGGCLGTFLRGTDQQAACRVGADGSLRPVAPATVPAS